MSKKSIHLATRTQKASIVYSSSVQLLDYGAMGHPCEMQHWHQERGPWRTQGTSSQVKHRRSR